MNLEEIRNRIDEIDEQLVALFSERMDAAKNVAQYKAANNLPVFNAAREQIVLDKCAENAGELEGEARVLFSTLMGLSRSLQHEILCSSTDITDMAKNAGNKFKPSPVIACPGAPCSYSHEACIRFFGEEEPVFYEKFDEVFQAVKNGECDYGILPIENSSAGSVSDNYDLLFKYDLFIIGAIEVPVNHCLMGIKGAVKEDIKSVRSHPQAISQCSDYINKNNFKVVEDHNTALAAKFVSGSSDKSNGVIASLNAAKRYSLDVIEEGIQDKMVNTTRFIVVSKELIIPENADKVSLSFELPHITGSLYNILARFAVKGLNLTKIESRPVGSGEFEYQFLLDFTGNINQNGVLRLLDSLRGEMPAFRFLGNYYEKTL